MKVSRKTQTVEHTRIQITGKDILNMLAAANKVKITKETHVLFTVPSGGDYSGTTLDLTDPENKNLVITVTSKSYDLRNKK